MQGGSTIQRLYMNPASIRCDRVFNAGVLNQLELSDPTNFSQFVRKTVKQSSYAGKSVIHRNAAVLLHQRYQETPPSGERLGIIVREWAAFQGSLSSASLKDITYRCTTIWLSS